MVGGIFVSRSLDTGELIPKSKAARMAKKMAEVFFDVNETQLL
ncbi:hypothetical protein SDC9_09918 [bioreactor metagenome]|uniref:Uncharacterized protein n=2 Tax=root TaxID=1 RepID=G9XRS8_DESHA|nr:hypothetical protein HMPREF0322_03675 [Desulfitobacterium hafniense DP7]